MDEKSILERLATLETKLSFAKEIISEIKDDIRDIPDKETIDMIKNKLDLLEKSYQSLITKVSIISAVGTLVLQVALKYFFNL